LTYFWPSGFNGCLGRRLCFTVLGLDSRKGIINIILKISPGLSRIYSNTASTFVKLIPLKILNHFDVKNRIAFLFVSSNLTNKT
jgi:hypothetical protein